MIFFRRANQSFENGESKRKEEWDGVKAALHTLFDLSLFGEESMAFGVGE